MHTVSPNPAGKRICFLFQKCITKSQTVYVLHKLAIEIPYLEDIGANLVLYTSYIDNILITWDGSDAMLEAFIA